MNSLAFSVGNYTPRNLSAPNTTLPTKNLDTTKVSTTKFSSHRQENFSQQLQPKESQAFFKRREAIGLGFCTGFLDVLLQQQLTATAEEAPCELTVAPSGLAFCDRIVGTGPEAVKGQLIKVISFLARLKEMLKIKIVVPIRFCELEPFSNLTTIYHNI